MCGQRLYKSWHRFEPIVAGADKYRVNNAISITYTPSNIQCGMLIIGGK